MPSWRSGRTSPPSDAVTRRIVICNHKGGVSLFGSSAIVEPVHTDPAPGVSEGSGVPAR